MPRGAAMRYFLVLACALAAPLSACWAAAPPSLGHWAFRPPVRPLPPAVADRAWGRTPLDAFVLARLERHGMKPAPAAYRVRLLRRVSCTLTGLPPTPEEVDAFQKDARPGAYERVVERLLTSPAFGERWGQHWLDVARYAESY